MTFTTPTRKLIESEITRLREQETSLLKEIQHIKNALNNKQEQLSILRNILCPLVKDIAEDNGRIENEKSAT